MPIDLYSMEDSPPCRAVIMTAKMLGVDLNIKETNLFANEHMKPEFIAINPQHNVPTIDDDGLILNESRAICAYLVNQYAKDDSLYPKDPKVRAVVDQRLYFDMGVFYQRFSQVYYPVLLEGATKIDEKSKQEFANAIGFLEHFLSKNRFAACDHLTIADIALIASASTMEAVDKNVFEKYPNIRYWMGKCQAQIVDYESNAKGAEIFGQWAHSFLSKLPMESL